MGRGLLAVEKHDAEGARRAARNGEEEKSAYQNCCVSHYELLQGRELARTQTILLLTVRAGNSRAARAEQKSRVYRGDLV
jgi:hypothetical protein